MRRSHRARVPGLALLLLIPWALAFAPDGNRVARLTLRGAHARDERVLLDDIPAANVHDSRRVKFGPAADGSVPGDHPFHGSPVWSVGHRNPHGLAWDGAGRLWATEHGQTALWVAGLVGSRLLRVTLDGDGKMRGSTGLLVRAYGRLRDVVVGPDGALYVATSTRDGRGAPVQADDRVLRVVG